MALPVLLHLPTLLADSTEVALDPALQLRQWIGAAVIIFLGLFVYGWRDLLRLHWRRIWAISGVIVTECLRRRVLWLTPLAIVGVIVVSQFQVATGGPEDAIRQTTKFCIFASGLLVGMTAIILASTNLPREIENRVIYTIVTKPTTRLEIILGKVLGFARVSGMIILIMGVFTLVYLELRARPLIAEIRTELNSLPADSPKRATDLYYVNSGLLGTRSIEWSDDVQIYAEPPTGDERWSLGGVGQYVLLNYNLNEDQKSLLSQADEAGFPVRLHVNFDTRALPASAKEIQDARDANLDAGVPIVPFGPTTGPATNGPVKLIPQVSVRFLDAQERLLVPMSPRDAGNTVTLRESTLGALASGSVKLNKEVVEKIAAQGMVKLQVSTRTPAMQFGVRDSRLLRDAATYLTIDLPNAKPIIIPMATVPGNADKTVRALFGSHPAPMGDRLTTVRTGSDGPVAVFSFRGLEVSPGRNRSVGIQVVARVERGGELKEDPNHPEGYATALLRVVNRRNGKTSPEVTFSPETSRREPILVDAEYVEGGDFDVMVRNTQVGQTLGIEPGEDGTIGLITADHSFVVNLVKSLFLLWLLSILMIIIAVFCSTFVSWPIAVVMTSVILLAHWTVTQLGDALNPGAGRGAAVGFGFRDPGTMQIVSTGFDRLAVMLKTISAFLPDVSRFPVMQDIQRGVSIPAADVAGALGVILTYGVPLLVLSYVILRRKEVAP